MLTHDEQIHHYDQSKRRMLAKQAQVGVDIYTVEAHCDWADIKNVGIPHFGVDSNKLHRNQIGLDTFHMKYAVTRILVRKLQKFMLDQSYKHIPQFKVKVLSKIWNQFHLFVLLTINHLTLSKVMS